MSQQQNWELSRLQDYLLYDEWDKESGFRVLVGFDYDTRGFRPNNNDETDYYAVPLDPSLEEQRINDYKSLVDHMRVQFNRLEDIWGKAKLRENQIHPPSYFIEWAISKKIRPPWLDWAIEHKLYVPKQEAIQEKIETANADTIYSTKWLEIQQAAIAEFFSPRREVDAMKEVVVPWIESKAIKAGIKNPKNVAKAIFTIIKPEDHNPKIRRAGPIKTQQI
jgi:hypothetical protein